VFYFFIFIFWLRWRVAPKTNAKVGANFPKSLATQNAVEARGGGQEAVGSGWGFFNHRPVP
jgi:hypothetical protein